MAKPPVGAAVDCVHCGPTLQTWSTPEAARAAASWHVYGEHRDVWNTIVGDRPPRDPDPDTLGERWT